MLAEVRDSLFTVAWFAIMTSVWLDGAQESPVPRLRVPLVVGTGTGVALPAGFGMLTGLRWNDPTALDGRYAIFGVVVAAEVVLAGVGAIILASTGRTRWTPWWVVLVVATHFVSLAWIFRGPSLSLLAADRGPRGGRPPPRDNTAPSSRWVGPVMGVTILSYAFISAVAVLPRLCGACMHARPRPQDQGRGFIRSTLLM